MKILHISHNLRGGAGKNLMRHHEALLEVGVESRVLIAEKHKGSDHIQSLSAFDWPRVSFESLFTKLGNRLEPLLGDTNFLNRGMKCLDAHPWMKWADIVEFRQIHSGGNRPYLPLEAIGELSRKRPVIWRLSDMWALTGFCAYSYECDRWKRGCGNCPQLSDTGKYRAELRIPQWDSSRLQWKRKRRSYGNAAITVVSPSQWMDTNVGESFLRKLRRRVIPIGVDELVYRKDRVACRAKLGLPCDAIALLAILPNPNNHRKGYDLAMKVVERLNSRIENLVLVVASSKPIDPSKCLLPLVEVGFQEGDDAMAEVYGACDILLFSSRADNSSQVLVEAGMSGLAVAAFDAAGNAEYLSNACKKRMAPAEDVDAMCQAIEDMASDSELLGRIQVETRQEMTNRFGLARQTAAFKSLYEEVSE